MAFFFLAVTIEFELLLYELQENSGDTEIVIQKANGAETEVELVVMVDFDILSLGIMEGAFTCCSVQLCVD